MRICLSILNLVFQKREDDKLVSDTTFHKSNLGVGGLNYKIYWVVQESIV